MHRKSHSIFAYEMYLRSAKHNNKHCKYFLCSCYFSFFASNRIHNHFSCFRFVCLPPLILSLSSFSFPLLTVGVSFYYYTILYYIYILFNCSLFLQASLFFLSLFLFLFLFFVSLSAHCATRKSAFYATIKYLYICNWISESATKFRGKQFKINSCPRSGNYNIRNIILEYKHIFFYSFLLW